MEGKVRFDIFGAAAGGKMPANRHKQHAANRVCEFLRSNERQQSTEEVYNIFVQAQLHGLVVSVPALRLQYKKFEPGPTP